jgi:hypothetical protein
MLKQIELNGLIKINFMNYENFKTGFNKPTIITGQQYGTKISIELDHSDTDIDELFDAFHTIAIGLGYHDSTWKQWIVDRADEYNEEDNSDDILQSAKDRQIFFDALNDNLPEPNEQIKEAVKNYIANLPVENEFDDYGQRITKKK